MRIWTAVATAVLLTLEALVVGVVAVVLGLAVEQQKMSMGGLAPTAMAVGAWVGLGVLAFFVLVVAALVARMALRGGAMGRPTRILLIVCAVLHAVLATVLLALSGVGAFLVMLVIVALLVLLLATPPETPKDSAPGGELTPAL
ncbi:hypothetical protein [Streptacidiphilus sp. EB129]|uniref:hypothetical protein n=1 Tax=Streptacidiphilus sp. EB129 TaxID=3156262 RepID=UPI003514F22D